MHQDVFFFFSPNSQIKRRQYWNQISELFLFIRNQRCLCRFHFLYNGYDTIHLHYHRDEVCTVYRMGFYLCQLTILPAVPTAHHSLCVCADTRTHI